MSRAARATLPLLAASTVLAGLLAACAPADGVSAAATGDGSPDASRPLPTAVAAPTTTTPAAKPTSPSGPALLTTAEAGKRYLGITRPYNTALEAFERGFNAGDSVRILQQKARAVGAAAGTEAAALSQAPWPTAVAPLMTELAMFDRQLSGQWLAIAAADSREAMFGKIRDLPSGAETGAKIRALLGLPKYDENDY